MDEHARRFGDPLRGLMVFASDSPDTVTLERYYDPTDKTGVTVLRPGREPPARSWRPQGDHYLFQAHDLPDIATAVRRWFELWRKSPGLGLLCDSIDEGNSYSAPRFLTLFTAANGLWNAAGLRETQGRFNVRRLVDYAAVDRELIGATKETIALIGATRHYHVHLDPQEFTEQYVVDQTFESTRRLQATLQAVVLRNLGMDTGAIEERLRSHYANWPVA